MDKVIIDGVDVSGCNNIDEWEHCNICQVLIKTVPNRHQCLTEGDLRCEFYPDCYYKQLKRLQAENEQLKKSIDRIMQNKEIKTIDLDIAKENAELKEQLNRKDELINDITNGGIRLQKECEELKKENDILRQYRGSKQASYQNMNECWKTSEQARRKLEKENNKLKSECERLKDANAVVQLLDVEIGISNKYRQALQEIREIAKEQLQDVSDRCINTTPMYSVHRQILDKINEVIGAE